MGVLNLYERLGEFGEVVGFDLVGGIGLGGGGVGR